MLQAAQSFPNPPFPPSDTRTKLFRDLLAPNTPPDVAKIRRAARSGIPPDMRPSVWNLLLAISPAPALDSKRRRDYNQLCKSVDSDDDVARCIRTVLKRSPSVYQPLATHDKKVGRHGSTSGDSCDGDTDDEHTAPLPDSAIAATRPVKHPSGRPMKYAHPSQRQNLRILDSHLVHKFTRVINTYLQSTGATVEYYSDMVLLCAPFVELMPSEADAFYGFNALMQCQGHLFTNESLQEAVSEFITLFRTLHLDLHEHFVVEEVDMTSWVRKWLRGLLVQQLPRRSLLRLWDSYFANISNDNLRLHPYVCLVFIEHIKPELQDCDDKERITGLLGKLPAVDIDHVIVQANIIREELGERGIL